jgi:hypothetical protein
LIFSGKGYRHFSGILTIRKSLMRKRLASWAVLWEFAQRITVQDLRRHARYSGIGAKAPHREEDKLIVLLSLSR